MDTVPSYSPTPNAPHPAVRELDFGQHAMQPSPLYRRALFKACVVALAVHVFGFLALIAAQRFGVVRVGTDVPPRQGISAFVFPVPQPTGTSGISRPVEKAPRPVTTRPAPSATKNMETSVAEPESGQPAAGVATGSLDAQAGPVRLGAGENLRLLKKVVPAYPPMMQSARIEGVVVLDAVIHRDGTIGDITVIRSSHQAFEGAAIEAVKQWLYTSLAYEGIVTVTLNFTVPR